MIDIKKYNYNTQKVEVLFRGVEDADAVEICQHLIETFNKNEEYNIVKKSSGWKCIREDHSEVFELIMVNI